MRSEKAVHVVADEIVRNHRVYVALEQFLLAGLAIFRMQAVDVVPFVVVDLPAKVGSELAASGLGVLSCNPTD